MSIIPSEELERIKADLAKANSIMLALVRDVAESAAEDTEISAGVA